MIKITEQSKSIRIEVNANSEFECLIYLMKNNGFDSVYFKKAINTIKRLSDDKEFTAYDIAVRIVEIAKHLYGEKGIAVYKNGVCCVENNYLLCRGKNEIAVIYY